VPAEFIMNTRPHIVHPFVNMVPEVPYMMVMAIVVPIVLSESLGTGHKQ